MSARNEVYRKVKAAFKGTGEVGGYVSFAYENLKEETIQARGRVVELTGNESSWWCKLTWTSRGVERFGTFNSKRVL
jgi:hypothetical protein